MCKYETGNISLNDEKKKCSRSDRDRYIRYHNNHV